MILQRVVGGALVLVTVLTASAAAPTPKKEHGVFYCDADWNGNGRNGESADVVACIRNALNSLSTGEDGLDNAITVRLPSGRFDVSGACSDGACFRLKSGIQLIGQMPRLKYVSGQAPDLDMQPDGGTWLDPGPGNTLFTGEHLRGVVLEKIGAVNFGRIASFGRDGEDGISFSTIRDVYGVGAARSSSRRSTTAWELFNIQHLSMDNVKVYNVQRGLHIISQNGTWQPANSVISDFYVYTYPDPPGGIKLEVRRPSAGEPQLLNYIVFVRPQVNAFDSHYAPDSCGIWLQGDEDAAVQLMSFVAVDVEGELSAAMRLQRADHNRIEIASITAGVPRTGISLDGFSLFNTIVSAHDRVSVDSEAANGNMFLGQFDSVDETLMNGLVWDRSASRWMLALGAGGRVSSGAGTLWYDDTLGQWRVSRAGTASSPSSSPLVTGTGPSASRGPVLWTEGGTPCSTVCTDAGMSGCVAAWTGPTEASCAATDGRRICACR